MTKHRSFFLAGLWAFCAPALLGGCGEIVLFDPKGPVGRTQMFVIVAALGLMLIVVIPVFLMNLWFPSKYRESNKDNNYDPKWSYSAKIDLTMWLVPLAIVTVLATITWRETHRLDPYKPLETSGDPVHIEAVSLDWRWLFIYPEHGIAVVNELCFPTNVPLSFRITSDTVMTSLFIPQLGSQIYAMGGMQTRLHLLADEPGTYRGQNQQFSGRGFSDMHFQAVATPGWGEFEAWVQKVRQSPEKLDFDRYEQLAKPSVGHSVIYFSAVEPGLFDKVIGKYTHGAMHPGTMSRNAGSAGRKTVVLEGH